MKTNKLLLAITTTALLTGGLHAAIAITDGTFDTGTGTDLGPVTFRPATSAWFEFDVTTYADGTFANERVNAGSAGLNTNPRGFIIGGYLYQNIGTFDAGTISFSLAGDTITDTLQEGTRGLDATLFFGTFAGTDGTDIAPSFTAANSITSSVASRNIGEFDPSDSAAFNIDFDVTGLTIADGADVWLHLASNALGTTANAVIVDNLSITAIPEPSSTALLGLGGIALILRRRR